jgi:TAT (twin-arginine translocation) pathway signal sequence
MNRRSFFKWLGVGTAAVVVAPTPLTECDDPWCGSIGGEGIIPHDELHQIAGPAYPVNPVLLDYADYEAFSTFVISSSIDDEVLESSKELGDKMVADMNAEIARHA